MDVVLTHGSSDLTLPLELADPCTQDDIDSLILESLSFFGLPGSPANYRLIYTDAKGRKAGQYCSHGYSCCVVLIDCAQAWLLGMWALSFPAVSSCPLTDLDWNRDPK